MISLRVKLRSLIAKSSSQRRRFTALSEPTITLTQPPPNPEDDAAVKAISDSFRAGSSWETLAAKFRNLDLHQPLVAAVLSELSRAVDAKRALSFFHWSARRKGFDHGARTYGLAIDALVRARMNIDAKALVESALKKSHQGQFPKFALVDSLMSMSRVSGSANLFAFDLLVQGYAKLRMAEEGFDAVCHLEGHGFSPSLASFNSLLRVAQKSGDIALAWRVYEHMVRVRVYGDEETVETLIGCLCKEGKLVKRVEMLERICGKKVSPSMVANSSLVFGVLEQGRVEEAMALLKRMLVKNMVIDAIAYSFILCAKLRLGQFTTALQLYDEMLNRGFRPNPFVYTQFIGAYCEAGSVQAAAGLLHEMEETRTDPYEETYSLLVKGYAQTGRPEESSRLCRVMAEKGFVPSSSAFNEMVRALSRSGDVEKADSMLTLVLELGFDPDEATYSGLIEGYGKRGDFEAVVKLFHEMESKSLPAGSAVFSAVVMGLSRVGKPEEAERVLRIMRERSLATGHVNLYKILISSYIEKGDTKMALRIQQEMIQFWKKSCVYGDN